ncbi:MAG: hypothetical protein KF835_04810 [Xanthobacteraceae bacterium]|nr:hypothetical protein [Xanthobacteraceae bacterium]
MRRIIIAFLTLAMTTSFAMAAFVTFEKTKFDTLVKSNAPVVVHSHEWW